VRWHGQSPPGRDAQVGAEANDILEADDIPSVIADGILRQRLLQVAAGTRLVADIVLGHPHHALPEHQIVPIGSA